MEDDFREFAEPAGATQEDIQKELDDIERIRLNLPDRRRRYAVPEGLTPGTLEYKAWQVKQEAARRKLYNKLAYLKKRKVVLAMSRFERKKMDSLEDAMKEVEAELKELREHKQVEVTETIRANRSIPSPDFHLPDEEHSDEIPFIRELTNMYPPLTYSEVFKAMNSDAYDTRGEALLKEMAERKQRGEPFD